MKSADVEQFQQQRPRLFSIAYQMLGSATEAEDVVQDAFLRFAGAATGEIRSVPSYLGTMVSRLCLDRLKSARAQREQYVGPWLPEPVVTSGGSDDPLRGVERQEAVSMAFLLLLETLSPSERAVFLLREVFDFGYEEIAGTLGLTPANCRQLFHRARERVHQHRPRFEPSPQRQRELVSRFLSAAQTGEVDAFASLLAEDVIYRGDGGGRAAAATKPVYGRTAVARLLYAIMKIQRGTSEFTVTLETVNGALAILAWKQGRLDTVFTFVFGEDAIEEIDVVRNPEKLIFAEQQLQSRGGDPA